MVLPTRPASSPPATGAGDDDQDAVVQAALARGDHRAVLVHLMRRHGDEMLRFCFSALGDAAAAEDVRQIIFVQAYQSLAGYQGRGSLRGWLYGIARHQVLDAGKAWRRRRWRFPLDAEAGEHEVATEAGPEGQLEQNRRSAVLHRCLRELQAATRVLVLLRYEQGMQYEEIARMTRDRPATIQARVARALPKLRDCLESKGLQL